MSRRRYRGRHRRKRQVGPVLAGTGIALAVLTVLLIAGLLAQRPGPPLPVIAAAGPEPAGPRVRVLVPSSSTTPPPSSSTATRTSRRHPAQPSTPDPPPAAAAADTPMMSLAPGVVDSLAVLASVYVTPIESSLPPRPATVPGPVAPAVAPAPAAAPHPAVVAAAPVDPPAPDHPDTTPHTASSHADPPPPPDTHSSSASPDTHSSSASPEQTSPDTSTSDSDISSREHGKPTTKRDVKQ